jgi:hypothetical protein
MLFIRPMLVCSFSPATKPLQPISPPESIVLFTRIPTGGTFKFYSITSITDQSSTKLCSRKELVDSVFLSNKDNKPFDNDHSYYHIASQVGIGVVTSFLAVLFGLPAVSYADVSPDWGMFEGKTGSLLHPVIMGGLLLLQISTATKGFQWRRQRTISEEIPILNKEKLPPLPEGATTLQEYVDMMKRAGTDDKEILLILYIWYKKALEVDLQVKALREERRVLASQNSRDRHFHQGAILAFLGIVLAIVGPFNTYARTGTLFPGPHLYAGAGVVICWVAATACVPYMQKGNDTARYVHIGTNIVGMVLFAWQVTTGIPILVKVWESTKWP